MTKGKGEYCYSIGQDCKQTKKKKKKKKLGSPPCAEMDPSPCIICPEAHNHFQTHKNHSKPGEELCTELVSDLYYALIARRRL